MGTLDSLNLKIVSICARPTNGENKVHFKSSTLLRELLNLKQSFT